MPAATATAIERDQEDVAYFEMLERALSWKALAEDALSLISVIDSHKPGITGTRLGALNARRHTLVLRGGV